MTITPVWFTGAEYGNLTMTTNGGGIANTTGGAGALPVVQSTTKASGSYAFRHNVTVAGTSYIRKTIWTTGNNNVCGTFKFRVDTDLSSTAFIAFIGAAAGSGGGIRWVNSSKLLQVYTTAGTVNGTYAMSLSTWYRVAWRFDCSGGTSTMYAVLYDMSGNQLDSISTGVTQTATNATYFQWGWSTSVTGDAYFDDILCSSTGSEHPIGDILIDVVTPDADGTHNAGTNVIEDNAGTDIGATTAYDKINSIPPSATTYIKQVATGTGNYAEVTFSNLSPTHNAVLGAMAVLAYTSSATQANTGGCVVSKDSFSSSTTVWGASGSLADYSDGATNNLFYKSALVAGVVDDTTVNGLKARMGYSGDASPNPYWIDLLIEVAYTVASGTEYPQSVSGGITPSGAIAKQGNKSFTGSLPESGTVSKSSSKTFSGAISSITGALSKFTQKAFSGGLTPSGILLSGRIILSSIAGSLTPSGTVNKQTDKRFSGADAPYGEFVKTSLKAFVGSVVPTGSIVKQFQKLIYADLLPVGTLLKQADKLLGSIVTSTGTLSKEVQKILGSMITPSGTLNKSTPRSFSGSITPSGSAFKQTSKLFQGAVDFAGTISKAGVKVFSGTLTTTGDLLKQTQKAFSGTVTSAGDLFKNVQKTLSGILTGIGDLIADYIPAGGNTYFANLAGTLTSSGSIEKLSQKILSGVLSTSGSISKSVTKAFSGVLTSSGSLLKQAVKAFAGTISPSGAISKMAGKLLSGAITPTGSIARAMTKTLQGIITPLGSVVKSTSKFFTGTLSSDGSVSTGSVLVKFLDGILNPTGTLNNQTEKSLSGSVTSSGTISRAITKTLEGTLISVGTVAKQISKAFSGLLDFIGQLLPSAPIPPAQIERIYLRGTLAPLIRLRGLTDPDFEFEGNVEIYVYLEGKK